MFGKGIAVQGSEWEAKTEELASRGISLSDLVGFYSNLGDSIMKSFQPVIFFLKNCHFLKLASHLC